MDCSLEELKGRVKKIRIIFDDKAPDDLHLTEIIRWQKDGREIVITVANWNEQKRAVVETFMPQSCEEIPMSLEDLFIECTNPVPMPSKG